MLLEFYPPASLKFFEAVGDIRCTLQPLFLFLSCCGVRVRVCVRCCLYRTASSPP
ncbi:hypothetical protein BVRB_003700 [Beta vulgaris subsp. vulgaris]|uniref:Uncharacterized protein n=1 Tax=Beta vulgaris subsp. vulgaris TaxID=3555 RepID=A0A0J8B423_BETVV|nr:hypothetical protein BVRB_003700 [Beta vulgaris subsp. vulgaris]